ncbi:MAG: DUF2782 domain-containing protein, partial [Burkholderiaceae bacterium]|nr:DUF2782 domain-containing protein [Burkholderiaceae bacterium]
MSIRLTALTVLGSLCCALALSASEPVQAAGAVPPPPDLSKLPAPPPVAAPTPTETTPAVLPPEPPAQSGLSSEPGVQETVVEDDGARIDELKVRGRSKRIVVKPKAAPAYEIIPPGTGADISQGARGSNGAVGKRVWPVMSF